MLSYSSVRDPYPQPDETKYHNVNLEEYGLSDDLNALDHRLRQRSSPFHDKNSNEPPSTPRELRPLSSDKAQPKESLSDVLTLRENLDRIDKAMVKHYSVGSVCALPVSDEYWEMVYYVSKQHGPIDPGAISKRLSRATDIRNINVTYDNMAQTIKVRVHCKDLVIYRFRWSDLIFNYVTVLGGVFVIGAFLL